jgi:multiple sugar transport system permease protein
MEITDVQVKPAVRQKPKSELWQNMKRAKTSYLMLAPYGIIFAVFVIVPVITAMVLSLTNFNLLQWPIFIGMQNYVRLFVMDNVFLIAVQNTLFFAAITGPIGFIASFVLAWMLNELPNRMRALMILIFYAPSISGQVYFIWQVLFSGDAYGFINGALMQLGILNDPLQWLQDPKYMMTVVIIAVLWMSLGAGFLSFVAGLKGVDPGLYEAGRIDGVGNRFQELWFITLPSMKPQLMFGAVMSITATFAASDVIVNLVGFPSTDYAAHTIVAHLMDYGSIRFEMGYACAIATTLFVTMIVVNRVVQNLLRKVGR